MDLLTYSDVGRRFGLDHREVGTIVRLHHIKPVRAGKAKLLNPEQIEQIRPDLERLWSESDQKRSRLVSRPA